MFLYHYTAPTTSHLASILADGCIRRTESNLSIARRHAGPDVVWLTVSTEPRAQRWAYPLKVASVLVINTDNAHHWPQWSFDQGIEPEQFEALARTGGNPNEWWVAPRQIWKNEIVALIIAPFTFGGRSWPARRFDGSDLSRLFRSAKARAGLSLPHTFAWQAV